MAELEVTEAGFAERLERALDSWKAGEEIHGFIDRKFEDLRNVFAVEFDVERLAVESAAITDLAANEGWREKIHLEFDVACAFAFRAAALGTVERETARRITTEAGLGKLGEKLADHIEEADISGRNRAGSATNGRLIDFIDGLDGLVAGEE